MALKGLDIFKLSPKKNCKECGSPTCMAFCMKVAQGAVEIDKCPYFSEDAKASLSEATAPPMKSIKVGTGAGEYTLGGETVLFRHEKTYVSRPRYATTVTAANADEALAQAKVVDYDRIGERMHTEMICVEYTGEGADAYAELAKKAVADDVTVILSVTDEAAAAAAVAAIKDSKPVLDAANASNYEAMNKIATEAGVVLAVSGADINELYDTTAALEKLGNKNLILNVGTASIKEAYANAVQIRRASLKDTDRTFGYPSLVNIAKLAKGDKALEQSLASLFTMKYGSIVVTSGIDYAMALALFGLRQNVYTDPQKPMRVEPGVYPLNGGTEDSICLITVDFALTYFLVSGELERSGVPCNLLIADAGGLSVLTSWAAGKFSSGSIAKFVQEVVEPKVKSRKLVIPGKVAVLKGDVEAKLPGWEVIVAPNEAVQLVKFLKDMQENGEI